VSKIKAVFFDFGNVIYLADQMIAYKEFAKFCQLSPEEVYEKIYLGKIEKIPDEGGSFEEFYEKSTLAIGANKTKLTPEKFRKVWCDIFLPYEGIEKILELMRPEIKKILVSNTNLIHWEGAMSRLPLIKKHFPDKNHQVLSFLVGKRKPNQLMWKEALEKAGCLPGEALFIDDLALFVFTYQHIFGGPGMVFNGRYDSINLLKNEFVYQGII